MNDIFLSVIIPAYNESKNFSDGRLEPVYEYMQSQKYSFEIILVDDGSQDDTLHLLRNFAKQKKEVSVLAMPHRGKSQTVKAGMLKATGQLRLFTDFDQSTPISDIEKLLPHIDDGYDIVIGSREILGAKRQKEPLFRHIMGRGFNFLVQSLTVSGIQDTQCGFKLFSSKATQELFPNMVVYGSEKERLDAFTGAFDVELLFMARKKGFTFKEVPVTWTHRPTERVAPIKDSIRMFVDVLRIRFAAAMGKYS